MLIATKNKSTGIALRIFLLILFAAAFVLLGYFTRSSLSRVLIGAMASTFVGSEQLTGNMGSLRHYLHDTSALIDENNALRAQLAQSEVMMLDRNRLYEDNLELKERMGRISEPNAVLAAVLVRPPKTPYDSLIIDIGKKDGVSVGDKVSARGALLIGTIEEAFDTTSRVKLYSSPGGAVEGLLRGSIPVTVEGQGGGSLKVQVPYDAQVVEGDEISIPAIEANVAFIVEHVEQGQGDSATTAFLRLPVSPFELKYVEVWRTSQ